MSKAGRPFSTIPLLLLMALLLLGGCVELDAMVATPTPATTPTPPPSPSPVSRAATPSGPAPTVVVDIFALLPEGYQPLSVQKADLDGDGSQEWIVLAGKTGQPTFENVLPLVMGASGGEARLLWRGQSDFAVSTGGELRVEDLTGDGRPEIVYVNKTSLGGSYAFVYAGGASAGEHPLLPPAGGPLEGPGFFSGWTLDFLPPGDDGRRAISSVTDLDGTRWLYRWDGAAFRAAEALRGTPFPTGIAVTSPRRPDAASIDVTHDLNVPEADARLIADLDGDEVDEIAALYRLSDTPQLRIAIFDYSAPPGFPPTYRIVWVSGPLAGTENQVFRLRDLTGDGRPEVVSGQGGAAAGDGTLYVAGYANGGWGLIRPAGGRFDGRDSLGEGDYTVREPGGGQPPHLLAWYDGRTRADVYQWASGVFKYLRTE